MVNDKQLLGDRRRHVVAGGVKVKVEMMEMARARR
jgi:hypothetical protein